MHTFDEVVKASGLMWTLEKVAAELNMPVLTFLEKLEEEVAMRDTDDNDTEVPASTDPVDPTHYN